MKKIIYTLFTLLLLVGSATAQTLKGYIYDAEDREPLAGATIMCNVKGETKATLSDRNGFYEIALPAGGQNVIFRVFGYEDVNLPVLIDAHSTTERNVYMKTSAILLNEVVVSAGRFEQKLSEITVSMDVLKKADIERHAVTDLSDALRTIPGVDINDRQPSIRGGSGWTYGVGSRALILVDGMSILSPGTGEINWNTIPLENVEQVEVLKGASSVLYGSSALNGLINIRTARPGLTPKTTARLYAGIYGNPSNSDYQWWDKSMWKDGDYPVKPVLRNTLFSGVRNPMYEGFDLSHSRRIGDFDFTAGMNLLTDEGYRQQGYNKRFNLSGNLTYHQPSNNIIDYGVNYNFLTNRYGDFLVWRSPSEALQPSSFTNMGREGNSFYIDPFYNFTNTSNNTSHKVKGRFYYRGENIVDGENNKSLLDILGNMGTDPTLITDIMGGDYSSLTGLLNPGLQGDLNGIIDGAIGVLGQLFPNATTADYSDLISWFMQNGVPSGLSDVIPWLSNIAGNQPGNTTRVDKHYSYYLDYQFNKKFETASITAGMTYEHTKTDSYTTGTHNSDNVALFFQYDQRFWDRLSVSAGVRGEYYRVDKHYREAETKVFGTSIPVKPIFRGGLNYQLAEYTFLRGSFGQGYRYPSITEKFVRTDIGGVGAYPNSELKAERGYNAEIGIKQGYKAGNFQGFVDVAGFYTQYRDMIEFRIGLFDNADYSYINSTDDFLSALLDGQLGLGAQFYNVNKAQIYGIDVSTYGTYKINPHMQILYNVGYVYIEPRDADYKKKNAEEDAYTDPLAMKDKSNPSKYLKYRQKHTVKGSFDWEWNRLSLGTTLTWKSRTLATDYIMMDERPRTDGKFEVMDYVRAVLLGYSNGETLESYWKKHNKNYLLVDLRAGVKATDHFQLRFMIQNLLNKEYSARPMALGAPRTYVMQVTMSF